MASTVKATLAAHIHEADDLPTLMSRLDRSLESLFDDRFVTAAACVIDPAAMTLRYAIAGHPPILLAGADELSALRTGGLPLGTALGWGYEEGSVPLTAGSRLLLFSDGLIEAEGRDGSQFGLEALADRFLDSSHESPEAIVRAIRRLARPPSQLGTARGRPDDPGGERRWGVVGGEDDRFQIRDRRWRSALDRAIVLRSRI